MIQQNYSDHIISLLLFHSHTAYYALHINDLQITNWELLFLTITFHRAIEISTIFPLFESK